MKTAGDAVRASAKSQRLTDAMKAKSDADKAVTDKSAEKGCAVNCRQLLQAAVDSAADEIGKARAAIETGQRTAEANLRAAKGVLEGMKAPESPSPFADRIGMAPWAFDVMVAALGSIAINGLACCLMIFGTHRKPAEAPPEPASEPVAAVPALPGPKGPPTIAGVLLQDRPRPKLAAITRQPEGAALDFLHEGAEIVADVRTNMVDAFIAYAAWCKAKVLRAMEVAEFFDAMEDLCKQFGIRIVSEGERFYLMGVRLKVHAPAKTTGVLGPMGAASRSKRKTS